MIDTGPLAHPEITRTHGVVSTLLKNTCAHPRLFLCAGKEEALQRKINNDHRLTELNSELMVSAEQLLSSPPVRRVMKGRRMLSVSRTCLKRVWKLAMAWRLSNDARFLDRASKEMLAAAEFPDWNPPHFLDVAEMTAALAIGYDWLHSELDERTRTTVRKALIEKGINPSFTANHWWINSANNWNQVCHSGLVLGALAVAENEPELAAQVIERAVNNVPAAMQAYAPDGAYPEGPGYWSYGTTYNVLLITALESALGTDFGLSEQHGFLASSDYMLHVTSPTGFYHNYSDCNRGHYNLTAMYWFAARHNNASLLWFEEHTSPDAKPITMNFLPFLLIWANPMLKPVAPQSLDWSGGGSSPVAFFRSGWEQEALFAGIKGGSPSEPHGHMDAGSFVFDSHGVRWAVDLGSQDYTSLENRGIALFDMRQDSDRWKIFRHSNLSHNMLVINNQLQSVDGYATVVASGLASPTPQAVMDCSSLFAGQAQKVVRTISFPERRSLIVKDVIESVAANGTIRWQMVTEADITLSGEEAILRQEGRTLRIRCMCPAHKEWSVVDISTPRRDYDAPNPGAKLLVLDFTVEAGDSPQITVELIPEHLTRLSRAPFSRRTR